MYVFIKECQIVLKLEMEIKKIKKIIGKKNKIICLSLMFLILNRVEVRIKVASLIFFFFSRKLLKAFFKTKNAHTKNVFL